MRVSKTVREYIEKKVAEAYNCHEAQDAAKEIGDRINKVIDIIEDEVRDCVEEMLPKLLEDYKIPADLEIGYWPRGSRQAVIHCYNPTKNKLSLKVAEEIEKNREAREKAVKRITLALELGGTKADLDRMLSELSNN